MMPDIDGYEVCREIESSRVPVVFLSAKGREEDGFVAKEEVDNHLACPRCGSFNTKPSFCCPTCRIKNLERAVVLEHLKCGNLDKEDAFKKDKRLVCPKCRGELRTLGVDYRKIGNWFSCREGHFFGVPWMVYRCSKDEGFYVSLYWYFINPKRLSEAKKMSLDILGNPETLSSTLTRATEKYRKKRSCSLLQK